MEHINKPDEYYEVYQPKNNISDEIIINHNLDIKKYLPQLFIELYKWKILKDKNINYSDSNIVIGNNNNNWNTYSLYPDKDFRIISLELRNKLDYIIKDFKNLEPNYDIIVPNIYLISILKKDKFNIQNYEIIRLIYKNSCLDQKEITILTLNNTIKKILYYDNHIENTLTFSVNSSLIPPKPLYTLEYNLNDDLGLILGLCNNNSIYKGVNLLCSQECNSNITGVKINTKDCVTIKIYMINKNGSYEKVKEDINDKNICLKHVSEQNYIKKSILIEIVNFNQNNILYLSSITYN